MDLPRPRGVRAPLPRGVRAPLLAAALLAAALLVVAACQAPRDQPAAITLVVTAVAGPTCPVVTDPPDPACADRPVEGAEIVIVADGEEVARGRTNVIGRVEFALPEGVYLVVPQPVQGLMGTASPAEVRVPGEPPPAEVTVGYDTGIR